jgi:hypothetical protein
LRWRKKKKERRGEMERRRAGEKREFFFVGEWDDRGSKTYQLRIPRYNWYVVSEVIYLMVDSLP